MTRKHKVNLKVADDVIIIRTRDLKKTNSLPIKWLWWPNLAGKFF